MNETRASKNSLALQKCWQTNQGGLVFQASLQKPDGSEKIKGYLIISPAIRANPIAFSKIKPEDPLNLNGLAAIIRKHCSTARVISLAISENDSDKSRAFVRLGLSPSKNTQEVYLVASTKPVPEIDFIVDGISFFRLRENAAYSVKKQASEDLLIGANLSEDQLNFWINSLATQSQITQTINDDRSPSTLSPERRRARDKVLRRIKTLKKTLAQDLAKIPTLEDIQIAKDDAFLLEANLGRVTPKMTDILIPLPGSTLNPRRISLDPRLNGGENLSKIYERIKRLERSLEMQTNRAQMIRSQLMEFNAALESLRNPSVTLSSRDISELLEKIKLAPSIQQKKIKPPKRTSAGLGRQFFVTDSICLTVGRNAIESDRIVKTAKSHEWWVHIAGGGHGAHVIISGLPPRINLPDNVLKSAAILALHFSDRTNALEGEVYCTRRQFIRKTKGLAAGLWIVDKSETYRVRYTSEDISQIFCKEFRQGAIRHGV